MHENTCTQQLWRDEELIESMNECHETDRLIGQALPDMLVISLVRSRATILHAHLETKPLARQTWPMHVMLSLHQTQL